MRCERPRELLRCAGVVWHGDRITEPHTDWSDNFPHIAKYCLSGAKRCRNYTCKGCLRESNRLHRAEVAVSSRISLAEQRCTLCREVKPAAAFRRDFSRKSGLNPRCRDCCTQHYPWHRRRETRYQNNRDRRVRAAALPTESYTREQLIALRGTICHLCGEHTDDPHIDHLIPLLATPEQLAAFGIDSHPGNVIVNLDIACPTCNYAKGARFTQHDVDLWRRHSTLEDVPA
jgi:hypothetical protein